MKGQSCLPNDPKIIVCICFGAFWICNKMLSYGRITIHFSIIAIAHTRWLFSNCIAFLPDARGNMLSAGLCAVRPMYRASHRGAVVLFCQVLKLIQF